MLKAVARKLVTYGVKLEILQLTFSIGAVCGMVWMAVLLTVPKVLMAMTGAVL